MYAYFKSGQAFVVAKGNPDGIKATTDLCGKSVAVESGTSEYDHLTGTGSVKSADGLSNLCTAGGKSAIDIKTYAHDSDALLALQSGKASAYFTDLPPAGYYVKQQPDLYEVAPLNLSSVTQAVGVLKDASKAGLQAAVKAAVNSMISDGTTLKILTKYSLQAGVVTEPNP
jgi:polar amino acid transport system substrate-binding protein